jgi:acetyltransferase-like isoleucine patch superfamily enzyme
MSAESENAMGMWGSPDGPGLPAGVQVGDNTRVIGSAAFRRFRGRAADALVIGTHATMDGVQFSVGPAGRIVIGNYCCFTNAVLMCELSISIGNYVLIGWNAVIADSDFHPIAPARRIADAVACSPAAGDMPRPEVLCAAVVIDDDVWIGPNATIFKGVHIGRGAWIGPGSVVTRDVPAHCRVAGNPARVVEAS